MCRRNLGNAIRFEGRRNPLMEFNAFTCQYCAEHQEWDARAAADSAAVWHLFDAHPIRWAAIAGVSCPVDELVSA